MRKISLRERLGRFYVPCNGEELFLFVCKRCIHHAGILWDEGVVLCEKRENV